MKIKGLFLFISMILLLSGCIGTNVSEDQNDTDTTTTQDPIVVEEVNLTETVITPVLVGWYLKATVQNDTFSDDHTVFGYLEEASDGKDTFDSEALGEGANYLYTTMYRDDFEIKNYRSEYRARKAIGEASDTWVMHVHSSDPNADVTLSWEDIVYVKKAGDVYSEESQVDSEELAALRLVDEDGTEIEATEKQYGFSMNGDQLRVFHWILGEGNVTAPKRIRQSVQKVLSSERTDNVLDITEFPLPTIEKR